METKNIETQTKEHQTALYKLLCEFDRVCRILEVPYVLFAGTLLGAVRHGGFIPWDDDLDVIMLREDYDKFLNEAGKFIDAKNFYLQKEFSVHWPMFFSKLRLNGTACLEKYHPKDTFSHQGVYIDIFPCDNAAKTELGRKVQFYASKVVIAKSLFKRGYETDNIKKKSFIALCRLLPMSPFLRITKHMKGSGDMVHSFLAGASEYAKNVFTRDYFSNRATAHFESGYYPIPEKYDELLRKLYGDYMTLPPLEKRAIKQHAILVDLERSYEEYADYRKNITFDVYTRGIR